ncbi:MAG: hypothetical protein KJ649_07465 [Proteobacteria bacterium]|nr:hypothetical protein [Pseudomonadota bacterium]MBU1744712.1 hypothetical protein [Pseudomonadota bacterium]MBU1965228.1 hypothetical protein [Pseudomonadota bacterium]
MKVFLVDDSAIVLEKLAEGEQIIAAPTLIKKLPLPLRRIIGDMSKTERVLVGLDLQRKA